MPISLKRIRQTGTPVLIHRCEACGGDAPFGYGVALRPAMACLDAGDVAGARRELGMWYCGEHRPERAGDARA